MEETTKKQLEEQRQRWNARSDDWDSHISDPGHYANFESGYNKFLEFEEAHLSELVNHESGIDLGCGTGVTSVILAKKVKQVYLLDLAEKMLKQAKGKIPNAIVLHASVTDVPLADDTVDVAISRGIVLSHLPKELVGGFFDELARIVRSKGMIIFDFLSNPESVSFTNVSPKIPFTKEQISSELGKRGFEEFIFDGEDSNRVVRVRAIKT